MLTWIIANLGTIVVTLILIAVVAAVIASMVRDHKKGRTGCGCGCKNCAMCGTCHKQ